MPRGHFLSLVSNHLLTNLLSKLAILGALSIEGRSPPPDRIASLRPLLYSPGRVFSLQRPGLLFSCARASLTQEKAVGPLAPTTFPFPTPSPQPIPPRGLTKPLPKLVKIS
jgi:hypothetical protein